MICDSQLKEPVTRADAMDHEEYLEQAAGTMKALFDRTRYQYQGDTWISNSLWEIHCLLQQAHEKMSALRASNCFPDDT